MKHSILLVLILTYWGRPSSAQTYTGRAWHDSTQTIPGKIQCERYDEGGQDMAYYDADTVNNGSGKLNPNDGTYLHTFRMGEGVDILYPKGRYIDNNAYNIVALQLDQLYVGWTEPGEWIRYSVEIKKAGISEVTLRYTAPADGTITLSLDDQSLGIPLLVRSTYHFKEPVPWKQWHHRNKATPLARVTLPIGKHVLTLHTVANGNMNHDYQEFSEVE